MLSFQFVQGSCGFLHKAVGEHTGMKLELYQSNIKIQGVT